MEEEKTSSGSTQVWVTVLLIITFIVAMISFSGGIYNFLHTEKSQEHGKVDRITSGNNISILGTETVPEVKLNDDVSIGDTLGVTGKATFGSSVSVTGNATFSSDIGVTGTLDVTGDSTFTNDVTVSGDATFNGGVSITDTLDVTGGASFSSGVSITGTLDVTGVATFGSSVTISPGHLSYTEIKAGNSNITDTAFPEKIQWGVTTYLLNHTGICPSNKIINIPSVSRPGDVGKIITVIQKNKITGISGGISFQLTTDTYDTGSYILQGIGGTCNTPSIQLATSGSSIISITPGGINSIFGEGSIMRWTALREPNQVRCEVNSIAQGDGTCGSIIFIS